ncbi:integrase, catalytic region, zinc finger, CCHC-type containing protein [Tanacetum coccineum]
MDYQCTQAEEVERNRVHEETMQMLREMIKIQEEKRIFEEAVRQEDEKRIATEKEAAELEAKRKSQECLNIEEKSISQASIRSRKSRIDPTLRNFTISTKRITFSTMKTVNSLKIGDKHLDKQKGSLESSVKDPILIPIQQLWMPSIYDENNKIKECYMIRPSAITPDLPILDSLIMEDEHLDTIPVTESANTIKSSVDDLVPTPSESADLSDGESECDVPINDDSPESHFSTFDNPLFDSNDDFSSDDESLSEEEIQKDEFKYFSNPLYDLDDEIITNEKILPNQKDLDVDIPIPPGIDKPCFNAESDLLESLLNRDSPIDSTKIDSIFDEFSLPRPPEESNSEYSDATIESLFPSPIPVEDSDSLMEEIDLFLASDDSMPPGIEIDDYDSEGDIRFGVESSSSKDSDNSSRSTNSTESLYTNIQKTKGFHSVPPPTGPYLMDWDKIRPRTQAFHHHQGYSTTGLLIGPQRPKDILLNISGAKKGSTVGSQAGQSVDDLARTMLISTVDGSGSMTGDKDKELSSLKSSMVVLCYVEDLVNHLSVSQICDKKHNVLFTDKECLILSPKLSLLMKTGKQRMKLSYGTEDWGMSLQIFPTSWLKAIWLGVYLQRHSSLITHVWHVERVNNTGHLARRLKKELSENLLNIGSIWIVWTVSVESVKIGRSTAWWCDHGTEFKNQLMNEFCAKKGIKREYSIARTPQQNGVAERKNRTLIEAARTISFGVVLMAKSEDRLSVGYSITVKGESKGKGMLFEEEKKRIAIDQGKVYRVVRQFMAEHSSTKSLEVLISFFGSTKSLWWKDFEDLMHNGIQDFKSLQWFTSTCCQKLSDSGLLLGTITDRQSTSGGVNILEEDWFLAMKETNYCGYLSQIAEYIAAASCCAQNPVFHSKTKHIQIRHHFIRDCYEQRLINVVKVHTDDNVADLLTKGFDLTRFNFLVVTIQTIG